MPNCKITFAQSHNFRGEKLTGNFSDYGTTKKGRKIRSPFNVVIREGWQLGASLGILGVVPSWTRVGDLIGGLVNAENIQELVTILKVEKI